MNSIWLGNPRRHQIHFSYLKRSTTAGGGIPVLYSLAHVGLFDDDAAKVSLLAMQYSSVYSMETPLSSDAVPIYSYPLQHVEMNVDVDAKRIRELDPISSPGPDGLQPLFLKTVAEYIAAPVCRVFRHSLEVGRLPIAWKVGIVKPIYKGEDRLNPANY